MPATALPTIDRPRLAARACEVWTRLRRSDRPKSMTLTSQPRAVLRTSRLAGLTSRCQHARLVGRLEGFRRLHGDRQQVVEGQRAVLVDVVFQGEAVGEVLDLQVGPLLAGPRRRTRSRTGG